MKKKAERGLAQSVEGSKKIWDFFPPVPAGDRDGPSSTAVTDRLVIPQPEEKAPQAATGYPCFAEATAQHKNSGLV